MEERTGNIFKLLINALYNFKAYPGFLKVKPGKLMLFALLMVCITYALTFLIPMLSLMPYVNRINTDLIDEYIPYFEFNNGTFYIEESFVYEDPEGYVLLVAVSDYSIPLSEATSTLSGYQQAIIISRDTVVTKMADGSLNAYPLDNMPFFNRDSLYNFIPVIKVFILVMFVVVFVCYVIAFMFGTLVCSLIGLLVNHFIKAPVAFDGIFKLTIFARTAPIMVKTLMTLFLGMSLHFVLFYGLYILYITLALRAVNDNSQAQIVDTSPSVYDSSEPYNPN